MLRRFFNKTSSSVTWAAALLGIASLASRFLGMFRDRLLSGAFGAGTELDAYYVAFRAPDLMFALFVGGAISAGFIPVFTRYVAGERAGQMGETASIFASRVISVLGACLALFSLVGIATANWFVPLYTSGFSLENQQVAIALTRIMFLAIFFLGLSAVLSGILQTYKRFVVYSLSPIVYNLGIILGVLLLAPTWGIYGVAVGVVFGAFLHMSIQLISVWRLGFCFSWLFNLREPGLREIGRMMIPRTASLALEHVNLIILTGIASTLGVGSIAVFNLALNLQSLPVGVIGASFAVASFPFITELVERGDYHGVKREFSRIVRTVMFLIIPATVAFLLLRAQIVRVVLGTGNFDWSNTIDTADALALFSISMFAQALLPFIVKTFFAFHNVKWPLLVVTFSVIFERLLAWRLVAAGLETSGLVLAFSVSAALRIVLLWVLLRLMIGALDEIKIIRSLMIIMVAAVAMGLAMQGIKILVGDLVDMRTFFGVFLQGCTAGTAGLAVYFAVTYFLGSEEARQLAGSLTTRLAPVSVHDEYEQH
ncbi:murein biosynthesis integral membrane protein MurJ [Patescibacteria group bacterium]|nr:murein biosynthesis integral membrane protein MurJ [Patescibacteria group bacterium]MBU1029503.1 murein biosynthesis integral membrane protein MurJ [Patescibacteria group bacterium]